MSKKHTAWVKDEFCDSEEIAYFFDRDYCGGASVTMSGGTLVFEGANHTVVIKNIGKKKEKVIIKNAADVVI